MEISRFRLLFLIALGAVALPGCAWMRPDPDGGAPRGPGRCRRRGRARRVEQRADHRAAGRPARDSAHAHRHRGLRARRLRRHPQHRGFREQRRLWRAARLSPHRRLLPGSDRRPVARRAAPATRICRAPPTCSPTMSATTPTTRCRLGWNALPGEIFHRQEPRVQHRVLSVAGIGSTTFAGDDRFTVNGGFGYRILPADWIAVHFDVRDHVYDIDLLGEKKIVNNLEAHLGLSIFF